ncbi:MAG: ester cyclase [Dehalococcoidia bacterium]|nr:ester cyclase [Dehalococcoidia bacterium]
MSEENEAVVRRAFEEVARGDMTTVDEIIAPEFVRHDLAGGPETAGPEGVKRLITGLRAAFPDLQTTIEDIFSDGEKVVVRFTARGTQSGPFMGIAPTGREATWSGVNIYRVSGGRIRETWQLADGLGLLRQLGAAPGGR